MKTNPPVHEFWTWICGRVVARRNTSKEYPRCCCVNVRFLHFGDNVGGEGDTSKPGCKWRRGWRSRSVLATEVFSLLCAGNLYNTRHSQFTRVEQQDSQVPGPLPGRLKDRTSSGRGGEKAAAWNFEAPVTAPLGAVSKIAPGSRPARPGPGAHNGSIGDALRMCIGHGRWSNLGNRSVWSAAWRYIHKWLLIKKNGKTMTTLVGMFR